MNSRIFSEPILVGRTNEIKQLKLFLESVLTGKGKTVFISGEAGSGKTKLIEEFFKKTENKGITKLTGWCLRNVTIPYFPFIEAFKEYFEKNPTKESDSINPKLTESNIKKQKSEISTEELEISQWLMGPTLSGEFVKSHGLSPQIWKEQTFTIIPKTLSTISDQKPVIFLIDDIHWADSDSLALIHYLSRSLKFKRILIVATFRTEELTVNKEGKSHPLIETLRSMKHEDLVNEIKIKSLNQNEVYNLAKNMLGGELQLEFAQKIAKESHGNPLYIIESIRMLHELGDLILENNQWRLTKEKLSIPTKIKDIILQRLGTLTLNQKLVLEVASVIGEKFNYDLIAKVLNLDLIETIRILDRIAKETSLVSCQGEMYKFDHASSRDAIYEEISGPLKKTYHKKIGERLIEQSKGEKLPFNDLAYHFARAENIEKAVKYALAAGKDALLRWTNISETIKHFSYVINVIGEDPKFFKEKLFTLEALGDAFYGNDMFNEAAITFEDLAKITDNDALKLRAFRKAVESAFQEDNNSLFNRLVNESKKYSTANSLENAKILISQGRSFAKQDRISEALENYRTALTIFEEHYSLWDTAWTLSGIGAFNTMLNRSEEGIVETLRSISLFEELDLDSRWPKEEYYAVGNTANFNVQLAEIAFEELTNKRQKPKGLEHADLKGNLMIHRELDFGNEVEMRLDLVNVGRESALLVKIENIIPKSFNVKNKPDWCNLQDGSLEFNSREIKGIQVETIKLIIEPTKTGTFHQSPSGLFIDELEEEKTFNLNSVTIHVRSPKISSHVIPGRISSGLEKLDDLLFGGIPEKYAVVLTGTPSDERDFLIRKFLEAGTKADEITFYLTTVNADLDNLLEKTDNFYLFLCNPKPKTLIPDLKNVYKLRSETDLTNLSISLTKAYRNIDQSKTKRICIDFISDILLKHKAETTRRWFSELITDLGSKGFTLLGVINPLIHTSEEVNAVLDLFDGQINLIESEDLSECKKYIKVKKLRNKDFKQNPICLT